MSDAARPHKLSPNTLADAKAAADFLLKRLESLLVLAEHFGADKYPRNYAIARLCSLQFEMDIKTPALVAAWRPVRDALTRAHPVDGRVAVGWMNDVSVTACLFTIAHHLFGPDGKVRRLLGAGRVLDAVSGVDAFDPIRRRVAALASQGREAAQDDRPDLDAALWSLESVIMEAAAGRLPAADKADADDPEWAALQAQAVGDRRFAAAVQAFCSGPFVARVLADYGTFNPAEVRVRLEREFAHARKECWVEAAPHAATVPPDDEPAVGGNVWEHARDRMKRLRDQGEPWKGYTALVKQLGFSRATLSKAVKRTPELEAWAKRQGAVASAQSINEVVTDRTAQSRERNPADEAAVREFIENADPETKGWFLALQPDKQLEVVNDPDKHQTILGRKP